MKTVEEKAEKYADDVAFLTPYDGTMNFYDEKRLKTAKIDYLAGYNEAMRWRDPKEEPPTNQDVVLVKTDNNCYATAYYHGKASGFITYGEDAYVEFGKIIGWRPI